MVNKRVTETSEVQSKIPPKMKTKNSRGPVKTTIVSLHAIKPDQTEGVVERTPKIFCDKVVEPEIEIFCCQREFFAEAICFKLCGKDSTRQLVHFVHGAMHIVTRPDQFLLDAGPK
jgi:hypothetical protein